MEIRERLIWFSIGVGVGMSTAWLFSPRSGEANRDLIRQKAKDAKGYVEDKIQEGKDSVGEVAQKTKDTVSEAWTAARESAGKSKEESAMRGKNGSETATAG